LRGHDERRYPIHQAAMPISAPRSGVDCARETHAATGRGADRLARFERLLAWLRTGPRATVRRCGRGV